MAKAPTYQELNRQKAENDEMNSQLQQKENIAKDAEMRDTSNPVLAEYMGRKTQQGLTPRDPAREYAAMAESVANSVPDQESYSMAMIDAAMKGQVPAEAVMSDANIPDQAKAGLVNAMRQNQGLGQL
jgi:hypothetical protein